MATGNSKQLTASVRLNTTQFENKLKRIAKAIDALNNAVNKQSNAYNAVNDALKTTEQQTRKVKTQAEKVNQTFAKTPKLLQKLKSGIQSIGKSLNQWTLSANKILSKTNPLKNTFGGIWSFVKKITGALVGLGTIKLAITGADKLTGAENRLNNIAANSLGDSAFTKDSSGNVTGYSQAALNFTQDAMDKMYVAAKNSRILYSDMMTNVSKMVTLAPDAFQGNIDNAIRFQEIMSKAYAIGGASATEMSTSMYQLTQALGSGVLQGDELRSVREGAPLAFQAIEEFAQGVLNTTDSLKDLASEGKITSEMVVAAVMSMGDSVDQQFALTKWRFSEVWNSIKSSAERAFQPAISMLTEMLNRAVDNGLLEKAETFFMNLAKGAMIFLKTADKVFTWVTDNWETVKNAIVAGIFLMIGWTLTKSTIAITAAFLEWRMNVKAAYGSMKAWLAANAMIIKVTASIIVVIAAVAALLYVFYLFKTGAIDACQAITQALLIVGLAVLLIGLIFWSVPMMIAGAIILALGIIWKFFDVVCGIVALILVIIINALIMLWNIFAELVNFIIGCILWAGAMFLNVGVFIINLIMAIANTIGAACEWVGDTWFNFCANLEYQFWNAIANMVEDCEWLISALNKVAEFFGKDTISVEGLRAKADNAKSKMKDVDTFGNTVGAAWDKGFNTVEYINGKEAFAAGQILGYGEYLDPSEAYKNGKDFGSNAKDWVNNKLSKFQTWDKNESESSLLDNLGEKLGLNFDDKFNFPTEEEVGGGGSGYNPDYQDILDSINGNTDKMADSMELTDEDLDYLRRIADMEWKKEYTVAEIKVDMTNNNTVDKDFDLHSLAIGLRDLVEEEMFAVADGVYGY